MSEETKETQSGGELESIDISQKEQEQEEQRTISSNTPGEINDTPPELPPKDNIPTTNGIDTNSQPITFSLTDKVSQISAIRQVEIYSSPQLNEVSDLFVNNTIGTDTIRSRIDSLKGEGGDDISEDLKYWISYIEDYSNQFLRSTNGIEELEEQILKGIPSNIRYLVYLKTLQVRFKLNPKETFSSLLARAKTANCNKDQFIENLDLDIKAKEVLMVLNYYVNELTNNNNSGQVDSIGGVGAANATIIEDGLNETDGSSNQSNKLPFNKSLIHICKYLSSISEFSQEEMFYVLLKFNKLFLNLIKDELFYKINRTLEDELKEEFNHISFQGINLNDFYKNILFNFYDDIFELEVSLKILDFVIFEGFDFILRLIVWSFISNKDKINQLEGDDLLRFIHSKEFFTELTIDFNQVLEQEPQIIKYENEFHLIHANSLCNNTNELTNLKEVNEELIIKINELKNKINNLQITHDEILQQSDQFKDELTNANEENEILLSTKSELDKKYEHLTMKENLNNTIKANKDFQQTNKELEQQVEELKKSIELKKSKLAKFIPTPSPPPVDQVANTTSTDAANETPASTEEPTKEEDVTSSNAATETTPEETQEVIEGSK
ncbi:uncharacterized protein J8A68_002779 [[Candida] subhashii]|uniref:Rab-GAP TBC domain-containing protein n=1 Tax=[Candida] subhashii TaxID=561895 RepID=A0A8J5UIJ7_9ASCO|nr:uncharacterized protein J8A68_002779 [[Candida] subhashii]KAG7663693.1 hypothetical protein J8A68_002779 [[Candida] subhashii]